MTSPADPVLDADQLLDEKLRSLLASDDPIQPTTLQYAASKPFNSAVKGCPTPSQPKIHTDTSQYADPYSEFTGPPFPISILPPVLGDFVEAQHRAMGADPS